MSIIQEVSKCLNDDLRSQWRIYQTKLEKYGLKVRGMDACSDFSCFNDSFLIDFHVRLMSTDFLSTFSSYTEIPSNFIRDNSYNVLQIVACKEQSNLVNQVIAYHMGYY